MLLIRKQNDTTDAAFRRSVRDAQGKVLRVLTFPAGKPVDVDLADLHYLAGDIGKVLVPCDLDSKGRIRLLDLDKPKMAEALQRALASSAKLAAKAEAAAAESKTPVTTSDPEIRKTLPCDYRDFQVNEEPVPYYPEGAVHGYAPLPTATPEPSTPATVETEQPETDVTASETNAAETETAEASPEPDHVPEADEPADAEPEDNSHPQADKPRGKRGGKR